MNMFSCFRLLASPFRLPSVVSIVMICFVVATATTDACGQERQLSYLEFLDHFKHGQPIVRKRIPVEYIQRALENADTILRQGFAHAALDLRNSSIEGALLQVSPPATPIVRVPLRFRNTHIRPRIAMPNVTFEEEVSFHDVILCQELDLAGSVFKQKVTF